MADLKPVESGDVRVLYEWNNIELVKKLRAIADQIERDGAERAGLRSAFIVIETPEGRLRHEGVGGFDNARAIGLLIMAATQLAISGFSEHEILARNG